MVSRLFWRPAAVLLALFAVLALALSAAGTASASTRGSGDRLGPERFTIQIVNDWSRVVADGPVWGVGTDQQTGNPALDVFVFRFPPRSSVNVWHDPAGQPRVDRRSCTASLFQFGDWKFLGGSGKYRDASGFGHFTLRLFAVLRHRHHHHGCDEQAQPVLVRVFVQAWGVASSGRGGGPLA